MTLRLRYLMSCLLIGYGLSIFAQSTKHYHADGTACSAAHMQALIETNYPALKQKQQALDDQTRREIYGPNPVSRVATVYSIPVVVHVVHFTGTAIGVNENITDAQIIQGITDLNDAFRNIGFYDPATGVDVEIEFCLAAQDELGNFTTGITRTANNALTDLDSDTEDASLKSTALQWDPLRYCNIWLVDEICSSGSGSCGTAGYAYLAGAHGQPYDGIVNEARFFGSSSNNSKVHIHEMGHYLNLRHTFQGGCTNNNCTTDGDQVCDTPPDNATTAIPCGSTINSCTSDEDDTSLNNPFRAIGLGGLGEQNDMFQNYMDYGFQSCQDRFTLGQKTRMITALTGFRASLLSSSGCVNPSTPEVYFSSSATVVSETATTATASCLSYRDINISMEIAAAPTGDAIISINYAGTANGGSDDYTEGTGPEIVFPSGSSCAQSFSIRIWDDFSVEASETIILSYTIGGSTNATSSSFNQTMTISIADNDQTPDLAGKNMLLAEDFSSGFPAGWSQTFFACPCFGSDLVWTQGSNGLGSGSIYISENGTTRADNLNDVRSLGLLTPSIDATTISSEMFLEFDLDVGGDPSNDHVEIYYNPNGSGWFIWEGPFSSISGTIKLPLPASLQGISFQLAFIWQSNGDGTMLGSVPALDNIHVYTEGEASQVETTLCNNEVYFGPNATVYVYNGTDNKLVARVRNLSNWDYGCTNFEIDRTGSSAQMYLNTSADSYVSDKSLKVTPSNNNASGNYEIRMYFSAAEVAGWELASGEDRSDLTLFKASDPISSASGLIELGNNSINGVYESLDYFVEATFSTGFSGFAAHSRNATPLPIDLLSFEGRLVKDEVELIWLTASELNNDYFNIEHSIDGIHFESIARIESKGDSPNQTAYSYVDANPVSGYNYYRLKQTDTDGTTVYAGQVIVVEFATSSSIRLDPNPVHGSQIELVYPVHTQQEQLSVQIFSIDGRLLKAYQFQLDNGIQRINIELDNLAEGVYVLKASNENKIHRNLRFVVLR